jgi:hypothetical protein
MKKLIPIAFVSLFSFVFLSFTNTTSKTQQKKLTFDTFFILPTAQLVSKLAEIAEVVEENNMPPAKFLEYNPDAALSEEQKQLLINWANTSAESLME